MTCETKMTLAPGSSLTRKGSLADPARETTGRAGQRPVGSGGLKQVQARGERGHEPSRHRIAKLSVMLKLL